MGNGGVTTVACIIIAGGKGVDGKPRTTLLDEQVIPSAVSQSFDEVLVVGEHHEGEGYRYLHVPDMTRTTVDALIKRDVGTLATYADILVYLCDDHALHPNFFSALCLTPGDWHVLVPRRYADHPEIGRIRVPNGEEEQYCAGHCGVFRRMIVTDAPWTTQPHHPNWDLIASRRQYARGFTFLGGNGVPNDLAIIDLEPEREPWR